METIGERIVSIRKQKGLTQEALSELAGINLRTLQRIEKDETSPRGNTLQMLCRALDVPVEDLIDYGKDEDREFLCWFQLSPIAGLLIPLGQIILPLILWLTKRDKIKDLYEQGANLINFQIWLTGILYFLMVISMLFNFSLQSIRWSMFVYFAGMGFFCVLYPIIVCLKIKRGEDITPFYPKLKSIIK